MLNMICRAGHLAGFFFAAGAGDCPLHLSAIDLWSENVGHTVQIRLILHPGCNDPAINHGYAVILFGCKHFFGQSGYAAFKAIQIDRRS